jgi:WD40 repeat protein
VTCASIKTYGYPRIGGYMHGCRGLMTAMLLSRAFCLPKVIGVLLVAAAASGQSGLPTLVPTLGPTNKIASIAYSEDGRRLITGASDGVASMWDVEMAAEIRRYALPSGLLYVRLFDHDRDLFTGSEDGNARIWDATSGVEVASFPGYVAVLSHDYLYGSPFAVATDGKLVFTADSRGVGHIWNRDTKTEKSKLDSILGDIGYAEFAPSGATVLVGGKQGSALFDVETGKRLWQIEQDSGPVLFANEGKVALTSGNDGVHFRDSSTGTVIKTIPLISSFWLSLSPDETKLLGGTFVYGASLWDTASAQKLWTLPNSFGGNLNSATAVSFSPDGRTFACAPIDRRAGSWDSNVRVFSTNRLSEIQQLAGQTTRLLSVGFRGNQPYVLGSDPKGSAFLWNGAGNTFRYYGHIAPVIMGQVSPDGKHVLLGSLDQTVSLWDTTGGERFHFTGHTQYIAAVAFSPDGKYAFSTGGAGYKWSVETGERLSRFGGDSLDEAVLLLNPSADGNYVFTRAFSKVRLWKADGKPVPLPPQLESDEEKNGSFRSISSDGNLVTIACRGGDRPALPAGVAVRVECASNYRGEVVAVSTDGKWVLSREGSVAYMQEGKKILSFDQQRLVDFVALSSDDSLLLTASLQDNIAHLWNTTTGDELCRIALMKNGTWVVVDKEGRFDTDNIEGSRGLNWRMGDRPLQLLPIEIFTRDYFTPGLLGRKIKKDLTPVGDITRRDTNTPRVRFQKIEIEGSRWTVKLNIAVTMDDPTKRGPISDLHIFRNSQLVARIPEVSDGSTTLSGIQLPAGPRGQRVEFSAYAFNKDHVKGPTYKESLDVPNPQPARKGKAYIITFGVNVFDNPDWNLNFAAADARAMSETLKNVLGKTFEAIDVPLVSDHKVVPGEIKATKDNLKQVLARLSGQETGIAAGVMRTTPEDLILIHFATHGYTDEDGVFYLLPSDIGDNAAGTLSPELKARSISSSDLTEWLLGVDAREIVLIIDACQSAALAGKEFRAGPLGDQSFGQLAYNKKIRLIVGAHSDSPALEYKGLGHGLLTYALSQDGLIDLHADFQPLDHSITLSEWLQYGAEDVLILQEKIAKQANRALVDNEFKAKGFTVLGEDTIVQRPVVFDFGEKNGPVIWGQPFFDPGQVPNRKDIDQAEFKAAADLADPVASIAALRRFMDGRSPGGATAASWVAIVAGMLEARAPSADLISAARMSMSHLALVRDPRTAAATLNAVAEELTKRGEFATVVTEFRKYIRELQNPKVP